jgi:hypothetical protein
MPYDRRPTLDYADPGTDLGVFAERDGDVLTITVLRRPGEFWRALAKSGGGWPIAVVVFPLMMIAAKRAGVSRLPRAVIEVNEREVVLTERVDGTFGLRAWRRAWSREQVGELRPNRFGKALFLRLPGRDSLDLLTDLDDATIRRIGSLLPPELTKIPRKTG